MKNEYLKIDGGEVYISMEGLAHMLHVVRKTRDEALSQNPRMLMLIPGSEATLNLIARILLSVRDRTLAEGDLESDVEEMMEGVYNFLDEQ